MGKYEEALERARAGKPIDEVFPELKESEDERIRKGLVHFILYKAGNLLDEETEHKFIAYLERQKEQKPINDSIRGKIISRATSEKQVVLISESSGKAEIGWDTRSLEDAKKLLEYGLAFINENGVKPAEWSEEYREEDLRMRFAFYTYKDEDSALYLSNVFVEETSRNKGFGTKILAAAEKVAETLGAIQIRLKVKQNSPANAWYRKHGYGYIAFEDGYDWLEKTLEYMKPIKPAEWSEEDEEIREEVIGDLCALKDWIVKYDVNWLANPSLKSIDKRISWLKALHSDSYKNCNSRWKPSDEHPEGGYSEKPNDLLSEAAKDSWTEYEYRESPKGLYSTCYVDGFKAGAEWMAEQGITVKCGVRVYPTLDGESHPWVSLYRNGINCDSIKDIQELETLGFKDGDDAIVTIRKKEKKNESK